MADYTDEYVPQIVRALCCYNVQKVLPAVYDDSLSYYEVLAKVQDKCNELVTSNNYMQRWQDEQDNVITELARQVEDFINGGYRQDFDQFAQAWLQENIEEALALGTHMVFFGLDDSGYFKAYIPQRWSFVFGTVLDYDDPNYGSLTIRY
jgi:hypothetical protein